MEKAKIKMMPFDIEKAKQGAKLVTRGGLPLRIICWDRKDEEYPIIALFEDGEGECSAYYTNDGCYYEDKSESEFDLFILDESDSDSMPELSDIIAQLNNIVAEAHELVEKLKNKSNMKTMQDYTIYCTEQQTRRAYELGAPIEEHGCRHRDIVLCTYDGGFLKVPTTQQMIGWLREKGVYIQIDILHKFYGFYISRFNGTLDIGIENIAAHWRKFDTYEQAELAAIDAALDYLEKGGKK